MDLHRGKRIALAAIVAAIVGSAIGATGASAVLTRLPNGQVASYQPILGKSTARPFDLAFNNMDYNGGAVMPSNNDTIVFWSPNGLSAYPSEYAPGIARFFEDLSHDSGGNQNVDSVTTQYGDSTGARVHYAVTYGGMIVDTDPYPPSKCPVAGSVTNCITDGQLQAEVQKVAAAHHIPADLTHELFMFTPKHVAECFSDAAPSYGGCSAGTEPISLAAYCAYHQQTASAPMRFYAFDAYVVGFTGCDDGNHPNGPSDGAIEGGLSHEHNESITDPIPNDAWTNGAGANQGEEVGDQCDGVNGTPLGMHNGAYYNQVINGHYYWYQEEWSNQHHECMQRSASTDTLPTASFTAKAGSGLSMTFDATGSSAPGGVSQFSWQFNDSFGAQTVESTSPTIEHTFPTPGAYSIGLTVFGPLGIAGGTGAIVTTGQNGFTRPFTYSPNDPASGQTVTFHGLSEISAQKVTNDLWLFGDGSSGSGLSPTHTYSAPGTYTVKVIQFSGIGSAYPGAGAAPVSQETVTVK